MTYKSRQDWSYLNTSMTIHDSEPLIWTVSQNYSQNQKQTVSIVLVENWIFRIGKY